MYLVSVVLPVYNGEGHVREAIQSILDQSFKNFELLIVNDGSQDKTLDIIESFSDKRIVVLNNEVNLGLQRSLNKGINSAKGKYIARQDADDISMPARFEKQVEFLEKNSNVALVGSSYIQIDESGVVIRTCPAIEEYDQIKEKIYVRNKFCHGSVMFNKSIVVAEGLYQESLVHGEDYDLWLRLVEKYKIANILEPLYFYRLNPMSISAQGAFDQERYAIFIRHNASQRLEKGIDLILGTDKKELAMKVDDFSPVSLMSRLKFYSEHYFSKADEACFRNKYLRSLVFCFKSVIRNPFFMKTWVLIVKVVLILLGVKKVIKKKSIFYKEYIKK